MDLLIFSQTLYYLVASFAVIVFGTFFIIIAYHMIRITKHVRHISDNLDDVSEELKIRIEEVIEQLSSIPILSYFVKRKRDRKSKISDGKRS